MITILLALVIFLEIINYLVIFDIILSWLTLAGINLRPRFLSDILGPLYKFVRTYIPTRFGALEFTPIIIIFGILFIKGLLYMSFPELLAEVNNLTTR